MLASRFFQVRDVTLPITGTLFHVSFRQVNSMERKTPALAALARRIQLAQLAKNRPEVIRGVLAYWMHRSESTRA
jgi:hypothetical protein